MMVTTATWINQFKGKPDAAAKLAYLKSCDRDNLRETFRYIPVPRCIFADLVKTLDEKCRSLEDLSWVKRFMVNLRDVTLDFDAEVLCMCLETTAVRLERLSRRLKQVGESVAMEFAETFGAAGRKGDDSDDGK